MQVNKAIVGRNAFAHEAGIHQDGMLKDRRTYEIMRAEDVGAPWNPMVLGKHSGRHAVQRRCTDLGIELEGAELVEVYRALMLVADERKVLTDQDVITVVKTIRTGRKADEPIDAFEAPSPSDGRRDARIRLRPRRLAVAGALHCRTRGGFSPRDRRYGISGREGGAVGSMALGPVTFTFMMLSGSGHFRPRSVNSLAIRRRSSRPTSHCFSATVLMRALMIIRPGS